MEIHHRKKELLEEKLVEQGEDEVEFGEGASNVGERWKPRDVVTSTTSAGTWR